LQDDDSYTRLSEYRWFFSLRLVCSEHFPVAQYFKCELNKATG
jgi:hypothetical protein